MKKVIIISTSLRKNSNSEYIAKEFERGAAESGNQTELITLEGKELKYCVGCLSCQTTHKCAINDDAVKIAEKVKNADVVVFATPVYYYGMSGQMKTLLDRMNSLFASDYRFQDIYLIASAADGDESAMDGTVTGIQGWLDCFAKARLAGVIRGVGMGAPGESKNHADILKKAYETGKNIK